MDPIKLLNEHRSQRKFTGDRLTTEEVEKIVKATQRSPSSMNAQVTSVITVEDPELMKTIAILIDQSFIKWCGVFVVFVADYNKMFHLCRVAGVEPEMHKRVEGLIAASVDVGIHIQSMSLVAQSLGYGTCMIGNIRRKALEVAEILKLPKRVFPMVGLVIGKVRESAAVKPRLPLKAFRHINSYSDLNYESAIRDYDQTLTDHWMNTQRVEGLNYTSAVSARWSINYYPNLHKELTDSGFGLE